MDFKKCPRCGSFFHSDLNVCHNCLTNENLDKQKLKSYFEDNNSYESASIQDISIETGISARNINRYMITEEFSKYVGDISEENQTI